MSSGTWWIYPVFIIVFNISSGRPHLAMKQKYRDDELRKRWTIRALEPCWGFGIIYRIQILLWRSILIRILPKEIRHVPKKVRSGSCTIIPDPTWPKSSGSDRSRLHRTALASHQFFLLWNVATCRLIDCWVRFVHHYGTCYTYLWLDMHIKYIFLPFERMLIGHTMQV